MLTVTTAADTFDLTILATVKAELSIETTAKDALLTEQIHQASDICATFCNRVFAEETVTETLRDVELGSISLERYPLSAITSITEDDVLLTAADYEIDEESGLLYRLSDDERICWSAAKIIIVYTGGYPLLDGLPRTLERACIDLVKLLHFSANRDPLVKSVDIPGVMSKDYWVGSIGDDSLPPHIAANLAPFRRILI